MTTMPAAYGVSANGEPVDVFLPMTHEPITMTKAVYPDEAGIWPEVPTVYGVGSSEMEDTDGHTFEKDALMAIRDQTFENQLPVILNHDERGLPFNLFGSVFDLPDWDVISRDGQDYAAIKIGSDVEIRNPAAVTTYEFIRGDERLGIRPRRLGFSVGVIYRKIIPTSVSRTGVAKLRVKDVETVHWAIVTQPSNRVAWIQTVTKSLVKKGVLPERNSIHGLPIDHDTIRIIGDWEKYDDVNGPLLGAISQYLFDHHDIVCCTRRSF